MLLLAIDTSTSAVTVAVHDGSGVLAEETTLDVRGHAEHLAPGIRRALQGASADAGDVTEVGVGRGPGPFTGLRVGLVTAVTFAFARAIPVHGRCSLDVLAWQVWSHEGQHEGPQLDPAGEFLVATDARRREVYWARYQPVAQPGQRRGWARIGGPGVLAAAEVPDAPQLPVVGRGGLLYPDRFGPHLGPLDVSAGALAAFHLHECAQGRAGEPPEPLYLRRPDAQPSSPRARVVL